jgi:hypothetical protein
VEDDEEIKANENITQEVEIFFLDNKDENGEEVAQ